MGFECWIDITDKILNRYKDVRIGDEVVYRNGNGEWYKGTVESLDQWQTSLLVRPPDNKKHGISVEYKGSFTLIQQKDELYVIVENKEISKLVKKREKMLTDINNKIQIIKSNLTHEPKDRTNRRRK